MNLLKVVKEILECHPELMSKGLMRDIIFKEFF